MARASMVTRTMKTTKVIALVVNVDSQEVFTKEVLLAGTYDDEKALAKALNKAINDSANKFVAVRSTEVFETLYGMDENEFISKAKILPPRGSKEI